jgi:hypothetical protein
MKRFLWLGFVSLVYLICTGCGDTFRPIIIPNPPTFPNPAASNTVVSINDNGAFVAGSAMAIDVSGDSVGSIGNVDIHPVFAVQQSAGEVLVVNQAVTQIGTGEDVGTTSCLVQFPAPPGPALYVYDVCPSLTRLSFSGATISGTGSVSLPIYSSPNFVAVAPGATTAYVTLPTYPTDPTNPQGTIVPSIAVVNILENILVATVPVGKNPYALAVTPDNTKLYVANQGDSTISGFNTQGTSQRVGSPVTTLAAPIWLSPRSDDQEVYVLEEDGTLASLSTVSTAGPDTLTEYPGLAVTGAATMTYDPNLNRLYIAGGQQMEMVNVSQSPPTLITTIPIQPFTLLNLPSAAATATSAAALPDGSRVYVASYATLPSTLTISSTSGDGTNATYAYTLTAGQALTAGVSVTVAGTHQTGFDGTFIVGSIVSDTAACPGTCFQVPNATVLASTPVSASGTGSNIFPQVTVVNLVSNTAETTVAVPGFPDATIGGSIYYVPACANARFRFTIAAGGDSSRAYLSSCDGGNVNIIDTSSESYIENQPAPTGTRQVPGSLQNAPQNPVFLIAGP